MKYFIFILLLILFNNLSAQSPVASYTLNNSLNDISGNGHNGTNFSGTATTNRFGTSNAAMQFSSGTSYATVPVVVQNNFTMGFWFKTTQNASSSSQWYGGNSLVDAEVCGQTNDWGTALINGGQVCFGVGNPDLTIFSSSSYNDGAWHFLTVTRDQTGSGTMTLYVDGTQVASRTSINVGTLNAPTFIGLARNDCSGANYNGSLDDLVFFSSAFTSAQVTSMYNTLSSYSLPLAWLSFTGEKDGNDVKLQWQVGEAQVNNEFEIERSADAENFSAIGTIPQNNNSATAILSFEFEDTKPLPGINYYRIKQTDITGFHSYSHIVHVTFQNSSTISLLTNPVQNNNAIIMNPSQQLIRDVEIFDASGRMAVHNYINAQNSSLRLNIQQLSKGFYFVKVNTAMKTLTLPLVKE